MKIYFIGMLLAALFLTGAAVIPGSGTGSTQPDTTAVETPEDAAGTALQRISASTESAPPAATDTIPTESPVGEITAEEAKVIALVHAGLSADQVKGLRAEFDVDDGVKEYEVEFHSGDYEYDYHIHAASGNILSFEKERND